MPCVFWDTEGLQIAGATLQSAGGRITVKPRKYNSASSQNDSASSNAVLPMSGSGHRDNNAERAPQTIPRTLLLGSGANNPSVEILRQGQKYRRNSGDLDRETEEKGSINRDDNAESAHQTTHIRTPPPHSNTNNPSAQMLIQAESQLTDPMPSWPQIVHNDLSAQESDVSGSSSSVTSDDALDEAAPLDMPEVFAQTSFVTPDEAYAHASQRSGKIERLLEAGGYTGHYSLHSGFNHRSVELQRPEQEIYIALESGVTDDLRASLERAVEPYTAYVINCKQRDELETDGESLATGSRECRECGEEQVDDRGGGRSSNTQRQGEGSNRTRHTEVGGGSGDGDDNGDSDDSEGDSDRDERRGGDRRRSGGKGDDDEDDEAAGNNKRRKSTKNGGGGSVRVPFSSTVVTHDGKEKFDIYSHVRVEMKNKIHLDEWSGPAMEVSMGPMHVDARALKLYSIGLGQIQISASSPQPMNIAKYEPTLIRHLVPYQHEGRVNNGFKGSVSASSKPVEATISHKSLEAVRSDVHPWAVSSHQLEKEDNAVGGLPGMIWNYKRNPSKYFLTGAREELSPGPTLVYGIEMPVVYPVLQVKMNVLWSVPSSSLKKFIPILERWRPAHLDVLHEARLTLDLKTLDGANLGVLQGTVKDTLTKPLTDGVYERFVGHALQLSSASQTEVKVTLQQAIQGVIRGKVKLDGLEPLPNISTTLQVSQSSSNDDEDSETASAALTISDSEFPPMEVDVEA